MSLFLLFVRVAGPARADVLALALNHSASPENIGDSPHMLTCSIDTPKSDVGSPYDKAHQIQMIVRAADGADSDDVKADSRRE